MRLRALSLFLLSTLPIPGQRAVPLQSPYGPANPLISPDGAHELHGSDAAESQLWIEDRRTHQRRPMNADPEAVKFVGPSIHLYVHGVRWLDAHNVDVRLFGHTNGERVGDAIRPGQCFDLRYRIGRNGVVQKVSDRVAAITASGCPEEEER